MERPYQVIGGAGLGTIVGAGLGTIVGAGLGTIVGAGLGTIVGAGLGIKFSSSPIKEQQNPPSSPINELS
ncbi:MAG: glycine zipper family protein [Coleofasciculus sp. A1-SPW-01]|uniref:glycine zipper family protein n=1 Tax=Coleofasciculus sp. A1-SPW-01 TaxID=3070819 RepID=UPI0032F5C882